MPGEGQRHKGQGQAGKRCDVFAGNHQEFGLPRFPEPAREAFVAALLRKRLQRATQADGLQHHRDQQHVQGRQQVLHGFGMLQRLDPVPDRKQPADAEKQHADHHRPEIDDASVTHRMVRRRQLLGLLHAHEQQNLVAAVGKAVQRLGEHGAAAGKERGGGLGQGDAAVGAQRVENGLERATTFWHGCFLVRPSRPEDAEPARFSEDTFAPGDDDDDDEEEEEEEEGWRIENFLRYRPL